jgi:hypothetical protein
MIQLVIDCCILPLYASLICFIFRQMLVRSGLCRTQRMMRVFASAAKLELQTKSDTAGNVGTKETLRRIRAAIVVVEKQKNYIF